MHHLAKVVAAAAALSSLAAALPAQASIYNNSFAVTAFEGVRSGAGFDTAAGSPFAAASFASNTASAGFTYTGPLNFSNQTGQNTGTGDTNSAFGFSTTNISGYTTNTCFNTCDTVTYGVTTVANYRTLSSFLDSSASSSDYKYGTYFTFGLGTVVAGTVLTITHDDGIALFQGATRIGSTISGPTTTVTETVRIDTTGDTILRYSRQNGTPSILQVAVPEPMSVGLLAAGLAGLGLIRRNRRLG